MNTTEQTNNIEQIKQQPDIAERQEVIDWLKAHGYPALPVAPAQSAWDYPKVVKAKGNRGDHCPLTEDLKPIPLFTGKNPSFLAHDGKPHLINHRRYQKQLPTERELKEWFAIPTNGIGTLGGWGNTAWLDLDVKQFPSQDEGESATLEVVSNIKNQTGKEPLLERTHSGGWRIGVRVRKTPSFTNFSLSLGGKHIGEALGAGRFTVLAPTIGSSGNRYCSFNRVSPPEVESLESIGVYPVSTKQKTTVVVSRPIPPVAVPGSIPLEMLGNNTSREILNGANPTGDRSDSLATVLNEWWGWWYWAQDKGIAVMGTPEELARHAGAALGIDEERIERIVKTVNADIRLEPSALYRGGEESCWKKIRKLDRATFEAKCPAHIKDAINAEWREHRSMKAKNPAVARLGAGSSAGSYSDSGNSSTSGNPPPSPPHGNGFSGDYGSDGSDGKLPPNQWNAPISWNGEIGWLIEGENATNFYPKTNFDFQIEKELASVNEEDGGGLVLQLKRSIDLIQRRVIVKSLDYGSAANFERALKRALGVGVVVNLKDEHLKSLIHVKLREYRERGGKTYKLCDRIGQQADGVWVFPDKQFSASGKPITEEESGWVFNPNVGKEDHIHCPPPIPDDNPLALGNLIEAQRQVAGSNFMLFLLCNGYVAAALNEQAVMKAEGFFPILNPCGDPGGGKTLAVKSALSLVWGDSDKGVTTSVSTSMAYEWLKCLGSIPTTWDDPPSKRREDKENLDEFCKRQYNKFPRMVRGNKQEPHSSMIPTTNHSLGDAIPATKTRTINLFFPIVADFDRNALPELASANAQAPGAFRSLISIGYNGEQVRSLRKRLQKYLPTAHDRAANNLSLLTWYTQKVVELAGLDIDVEKWVSEILCPELNELQTGLNSSSDFIERLTALKETNQVGSWNLGIVTNKEYGTCLALHMPSIWRQVESSGDSPPYSRTILERLLVELGAIKNKPARLNRDRDSALAYQREIHKGVNKGSDWSPPTLPEPVPKKCLLIPERLWKSLGVDFLEKVTSDNHQVTSCNQYEVTGSSVDQLRDLGTNTSQCNFVTNFESEQNFDVQLTETAPHPSETFSQTHSPLTKKVTWLPESDETLERLENTSLESVTNESYSEVTSLVEEVTSAELSLIGTPTASPDAQMNSLQASGEAAYRYQGDRPAYGCIRQKNGKSGVVTINAGDLVVLIEEGEHSNPELVYVRPLGVDWEEGIVLRRSQLEPQFS